MEMITHAEFTYLAVGLQYLLIAIKRCIRSRHLLVWLVAARQPKTLENQYKMTLLIVLFCIPTVVQWDPHRELVHGQEWQWAAEAGALPGEVGWDGKMSQCSITAVGHIIIKHCIINQLHQSRDGHRTHLVLTQQSDQRPDYWYSWTLAMLHLIIFPSALGLSSSDYTHSEQTPE